MENKQLEQIINNYCVMTSGEACVINITSRTRIDNEAAELIKFEFGEDKEPCVAILYDDGTLFLPHDWASPILYCDNIAIDDIEWICSDGRSAINLNGMPRLLF